MKNIAKEIQLNNVLRKKAVLLILALFCLTIVLLLIHFKSTGAWLYDSEQIKVDYSIVELEFDLSSNHMYYYYKDDPNFQDSTASATAIRYEFKKTVVALAEIQKKFDDPKNVTPPNVAAYDAEVKTELNKIYPTGLITSLDALHKKYADKLGKNATVIDTSLYNNEAKLIYNEYSDQMSYPFRMRNLALDKVEDGKSIWYYQVADILNMYLGEYMVLQKSDGLSTSTVRIGVKLPGGTTYKTTEGAVKANYYDEDFNKMVVPLNLRFENTADARTYATMNMKLDQATATTQEGILCMLMPRGDEISVNDSVAPITPTYIDGDGKLAVDYRTLIGDRLSTSFLNGLSEYNGWDWYNLSYSQLRQALASWNAEAKKSYEQEFVSGAGQGNIPVGKMETGNPNANCINANMIFWADYETCMKSYNKHIGVADNSQNDNWAVGNVYEMISYNFSVDVYTSFKDTDLRSLYAGGGTPDTSLTESYILTKKYDTYAGVSNFDVEGYPYFISGNTVTPAKKYMQDGYIICDYGNSNAINNIENFRFDVYYKGFSPAYIRVGVAEQWTNPKKKIMAVEQIKFKKGANWVDNRVKDLYFYSPKQYYSVDSDALTTDGTPKKITIPVITGIVSQPVIPNEEGYTNLTLKLSINIDTVQPNRFQELWNINKIPTKDATASDLYN